MKTLTTPSQQIAGKRTGILLAIMAAALWGLTPVATKMALEGFTPEFIGFVRLAVAAALFRAAAGRPGQWFNGDPWIWLAGAGLGADFLLYNYGVQKTAANVAGLVINIELISTIVLAIYLLGERLSRHRVLGGGITLIGVLIVTLDGLKLSDLTEGGRTLGNILVMLAGIAWSVFAVAQRRAKRDGNLFQRLTPIFSVAAVMSAPALLRNGSWTVRGGVQPVMMFVILTLFGTNAVYWIYARAQELIEVSVLSILLCTIPVFAVVLAYIFLNERLTVQSFVGGAVIISGIAVIATEKTRAKTII